MPAEQRCHGTPEETFLRRYPYADYFRGTIWSKSLGDFGGHDSLKFKAAPPPHGLTAGVRMFGLFREPRARSLSSYHHFRSLSVPRRLRGIRAPEYAARIAGTATKMLAGQMKGGLDCAALYYPCRSASVAPDVPRALAALRRFAFVGLTERFNLSICLLHLMFGGECRAVEFANIRPGGAGQASEAELLALPRDDADEAVYAAARARFERDTRAYGATPSACRERCPGVEFSHSR